MRPDFNSINITADAFSATAKAAPAVGKTEEWLTPELIPVKPIYTKDDLQGMEHLDYVAVFLRSCAVRTVACMPCVHGPSDSMPASPPQPNQTRSTAATSRQGRKAFQ